MIIDLTKTIADGMPVYEGDPQVSLTKIADINHDGYQNYQLNVNMHAGTHVDGLAHMLAHKPLISEYPLDRFIGRARYVTDELPYINLGESIVVVKMALETLNPSFVDAIIKANIKMVVTDKESVDQSPYLTHKKLFSSDIMIVENALDIDRLKTIQSFTLYAIPLKVSADSAPVRLFAIY